MYRDWLEACEKMGYEGTLQTGIFQWDGGDGGNTGARQFPNSANCSAAAGFVTTFKR